MSRNGSGVYTPPAGTTAVSGATIESAKYNSFVSDIGDEMTGSVPRNGTAAMTANLPMGNFRLTGLGAATALTDGVTANQVQTNAVSYAAIAGTDTYTITLAPAATAYTTGMVVWGKVTNANTSTTPTLNVNGIGSKTIVKGVSTALAAGDMAANQLCFFIYDGTNFAMLNPTAGIEASTTVKGTVELSTAAEYRNDTAGRALTGEFVWDAAEEVTLTDAATVAVDMATFINATVTLAGNRTLGNPTNAKTGQTGYIRIVQDGTGTRTLAYASNWEFAGGIAPVLSTTAADEDVLTYVVLSSTRILATLIKDIS